MATRSIRLPIELLQQLDSEAAARGFSTNFLIVQLCREGLEHLDPDFRVTNFAEVEIS